MVVFLMLRGRKTMRAVSITFSLLVLNLLACNIGTVTEGDSTGSTTENPTEARPVAGTTEPAKISPAEEDGTPVPRSGDRDTSTPGQSAPGQLATPIPAHAVGLKPRLTNTSVETDRQALVNLFNATGGERWDDSNTWASGRPLGDWEGVETDDEDRVIGLNLHFPSNEKQPDGDLLTEVYKLTELRNLRVYSKRSEEFPREFGYLSELRYLEMSGNSVRGQIPVELGELSNLVRLDLNSESFEGAVPPEIFELPRLYEVRISGDDLHLHLSETLEEFLLRGTDVRMNVGAVTGCLSEYALSWYGGNISASGASWEMLVCKSVHEGDLDVLREIFKGWRDHGSFDNWLTRVPVYEWEGITLDRNGRVAELYINGLDDSDVPPGLLPEAIGRLTGLRALDLSGLGIEGEIPEWIGNLTQLEKLELHENGFSGEIPGWIADLTRLQEIALFDNNLSGEVPDFLSSMPNLWWIELGGNDLSGCLPNPPEKLQPIGRGEILWLGPDGKPGRHTGVPSLSGVEYCP